MLFTIVNPDNVLLRIEARLIQLPGLDGSFEVMDRHAPILSMLRQGKVRIVDKEGKETFFDVWEKGIFAMANNEARLLLL